MNAVLMGLLLLVALTAFAFSASKRWKLLTIGSTPPAPIDRIPERLRLTFRQAIGQQRLTRYPLAGLAHKAIFFGFFVLTIRSLILFARGFTSDPTFGYWIFDTGTPLGNLYSLLKDLYIVLVLSGVLVFAYLRLISKPARMTRSAEGLLILAVIFVMMLADILYDAGAAVLHARAAETARTGILFDIWSPLGSLAALPLADLSDATIRALWHTGFWVHVVLVLGFLNLLPYSKHFHVITAIPNIFLQSLDPPGRLRPIEDLEGKIEREETLGVRRIDQLGWKGILDLYTCTECGRCTDHCPAARTGKPLAPHSITIGLRDFLYEHADALIAKNTSAENDAKNAEANSLPHQVDLVPAVVSEEALWACTTCRACEQECPVGISYVEKIVNMRRYLVQERGQCPTSLQEMFQSVEIAGNPYSAPDEERMKWAEGLDVPLCAQADEIDVLFWVGCAPAIDQRARATARAMVDLLNAADIRWACLGPEERCTGDAARRAGNEYLFQAMARSNIETLDRYNTKTIVTICPHCYNTLKNEYPDFGGHYEVIHHTDYLAQLLAQGTLAPQRSIHTRIVYHDSCYLSRYNDIEESPRRILRAIPGVELVEADASRDRSLCCGAGGAQAFKEEEPNTERINTLRLKQLQGTGATTICTACPFCLSMLSSAPKTDDASAPQKLDIAEILLQSLQEPSNPKEPQQTP